ncbi:unnamed protein product [Meloidogyne enterolobii]|uniref:Uncharacterized protein n=1 Tax=Meloidogyne enterolobii TaxID=390850 RepID=A0ACB1A3N5_MELEN
MVSQLIQENVDFLKELSKTKSERKKRRLIKLSNTNQLLAIAEICLNVVKSRLQLNARQKKRLMPHINFVRQMSRARSERGARQILRQKGTGIGVFAALITPVLMELARSIGNIKGTN